MTSYAEESARLLEESARLAREHARLLKKSARLWRRQALLIERHAELCRAAGMVAAAAPAPFPVSAEIPADEFPAMVAPAKASSAEFPAPALVTAASDEVERVPTSEEAKAIEESARAESEQVQALIEIYLKANGLPRFEGFEADIAPKHSGRCEGFAANRCGQGPALIYLPGIQSNDLLFWPNRAGLAGRFTVYGVSYRTAGEPTPERYAGDILELMDAEGVEKAHLLGESMGSIPAQWLAVRHPDRVESVVLAGGFASAPDQFRMTVANMFKPLVPTGLTRWLIHRFLATRAKLKKDSGGHLSPEIVEAFAQLKASSKVRVMRRRLRMISQWDFHDELPNIRCPFLYMCGSRDVVVPVQREAKRYRKQIAHAEFREFPGAAHSILFTRPEETNEALLEFALRDRSLLPTDVEARAGLAKLALSASSAAAPAEAYPM
jgi:pimeloyl-ACP methyl ester carboxylesterase